jgi:methionyl-tRNA synthetase
MSSSPSPERPRYFLTTAIDYPNSRPHIGTAFEKIGADVQARFRRMEGFDVHFLMGNDENTIKVSQRAGEMGLAPKAYVDDMARQFREVWAALSISNDDFIQTSEDRHHEGCRAFLQKVHDADEPTRLAVTGSSEPFLYKKAYTGQYCNGCEAFKTEKELVEGRCPNHPGTPLKLVEEENWFFRLSAFADRLLRHYEENPGFIQPESRRNEIVNLVRTGLQDVSISRRGFTWGIPVPFDPDQTIYVWFDALLNYATAVGYGRDPERLARWWPAQLHVIGKDITRFHCALWPAMLLAAGEPLPEKVFAHGFVYRKNEESGALEKMSKTIGNVVEPMDLIRVFGADAFRHYFMSQCPFGGDGEFSFERFTDVYNADLANNLGNLYSRILAMALRYFDGDLGGTGEANRTAWRGGLDLPRLTSEIHALVGSFQYNVATQRIWQEVLASANQYIQATEPFKLVKTDPDATRIVLTNLAEWVRVAAILLKPFLPGTSEAFYRAFDFERAKPWADVRYDDVLTPPPGHEPRLTAPLVDGKVAALFPKIEPAK